MNLVEFLKDESDVLDKLDEMMLHQVLQSIQPDANGMCNISFPTAPEWITVLCSVEDSK